MEVSAGLASDPILPGRRSACPAIASASSEKTTPRFLAIIGRGTRIIPTGAGMTSSSGMSIFPGDHALDAVVVLSDPRLKGSDLVYHVDILEGKIPATAGISTLFIDSAVRRVARRTSRRTARRVERRHD